MTPASPKGSDLEAAVAAGVLDAATAARLAEFLAARASPPRGIEPDPDDERFRLIAGFNDIFVTIGLAMVAVALTMLIGSLALAVGCALAWGLAEIFTRRRRMALPSIVLSLLFAGCAAGALFVLLRMWIAWRHPAVFSLVGLVAAGAAAIHFRRFRVPIDVAICAVALVAVAVHALHVARPQFVVDRQSLIAIAAGLTLFALAMRHDLADPSRRTARADVAFWLHLCAAPLIVHGSLAPFFPGRAFNAPAGALAVFWGLALVYFLVAIVIDRRAVIVSSLGYVVAALFFVLNGPLSLGAPAAASALVVGAAMLALSVWWRPLRSALLAILPLGRLAAHLPPARV